MFRHHRTQAVIATGRAHFTALLLGGLMLTSPGCKTTARTSAKVLTTGARVTEKVATTTGKTTGKVAIATTKTTSKAAVQGARAAVSIAKIPMVTLKDTATGLSKQIPWSEGMKLYAASKTAEFNTYLKAFTIFRDGTKEVIHTDWARIKAGSPEPILRPGDVVEISALR